MSQTPSNPAKGRQFGDLPTPSAEVANLVRDDTALRRSAVGHLYVRYGEAARRYLLGGLRRCGAAGDLETIAEDLLQDVFRDMQAGSFARFSPGRSFRAYLRTVLRNRVNRHLHETRHFQTGATFDATDTEERAYDESCAEGLLRAALERLRCEDERLYEEVLARQGQDEVPTVRSRAAELTKILGRRVTATDAHRLWATARARYCDLIVDEIARQFADPTADDLAQELCDLGLHTCKHLRQALERRSR